MARMEDWNEFKKNAERILRSDPVDDKTLDTCRILLKKGDEIENKQTSIASSVKMMLDMADIEILNLRNLDPWTGFTQLVGEYLDTGVIERNKVRHCRRLLDFGDKTESERKKVYPMIRASLPGFGSYFPKNLSDWKEAMEEKESEIKSSLRRLKGLPRSGMKPQKKTKRSNSGTSSVSEGADPDLDSHFHQYGDFYVKFDDEED